MSLTNRDLAVLDTWEAPIRIECDLPGDLVGCLICPLYRRCPRVRELWRRLMNGWIREAMVMEPRRIIRAREEKARARKLKRGRRRLSR